MCFCVLLYFTACMLYYCNTVGWAWWDLGLIWWLTILLQCFDTVGWVTWPVKISSPNDLYCVEWDVKPYSTHNDSLERLVSEMTYYGSSGTLNPTHSLTPWWRHWWLWVHWIQNFWFRLDPDPNILEPETLGLAVCRSGHSYWWLGLVWLSRCWSFWLRNVCCAVREALEACHQATHCVGSLNVSPRVSCCLVRELLVLFVNWHFVIRGNSIEWLVVFGFP